jgi:hypothetical protein
MADPSLCETVCRESGWLGEVVVFVLLAGRTLYVQWRNRTLATKAVSLEAKVRELSLRPPATPLTLQLAPYMGPPSLAPIAMTGRPSTPSSVEKNAQSDTSAHPLDSDPDYADPPQGEP